MQITTKGQVTIPLQYREEFGLLPHTEVEFIIENGKLCLEKVKSKFNSRGQTLIANLRGTASVKMTTDEIMGLTRGKK